MINPPPLSKAHGEADKLPLAALLKTNELYAKLISATPATAGTSATGPGALSFPLQNALWFAKPVGPPTLAGGALASLKLKVGAVAVSEAHYQSLSAYLHGNQPCSKDALDALGEIAELWAKIFPPAGVVADGITVWHAWQELDRLIAGANPSYPNLAAGTLVIVDWGTQLAFPDAHILHGIIGVGDKVISFWKKWEEDSALASAGALIAQPVHVVPVPFPGRRVGGPSLGHS